VFVAGFIGSPSMSFATMRAETADGTLTLSRGDLSLALPQAPTLDRSGGEVILGARPEHTRLWSDGAGLLGPIDGRAEYVEMLGRES